MAVISGHGATLGFGTYTTFSPKYTTIGGFEATRESLVTSDLSTTGAHTKIGGDLFDVGPFSSTFLFEPELSDDTGSNNLDGLLFATGEIKADQVVTITYPDTGAATVAGTAHVTGVGLEDLSTDTLCAANITVQFNDWPTFTP